MNNVEARKRFLIVSLTEIAKEPRVARQIRVLSEFGTVETIGFGDKPVGVLRHQSLDKPQGVKFGRYELKSIPIYGLTVFAMLLHLHALTGLLLPGAYQLRRKLGKTEFDVLVVRDLQPLVVVNKYFAKKPVWVDLPEFTPRQNESSKLWRILFAPYYRWVASNLLGKCQVATTLGQGISNEYKAQYGIEPRVVKNSANFMSADAPLEIDGYPLRLVHSGAAIRARKLEEMIEAISSLAPDYFLDLYLIKTDIQYFSELRELSNQSSNCRVLDPVDTENLIPTLSRYDISLVVIPPTSFNYENTLPNKFFDAIQARLAILTGPTREISQIVSEHHLGITSAGFDANSIKAAVREFNLINTYEYKLAAHYSASILCGEVEDEVIRSLIVTLKP